MKKYYLNVVWYIFMLITAVIILLYFIIELFGSTLDSYQQMGIIK